MNNVIEKVKENIYLNDMIKDGDIIIVGVSGGPDSIFLLHALNVLKETIKKEKGIIYNIEVAHINHKIREEATNDQKLVKMFCDKHGINFHLLEFDVLGEAKKLKISTEECGRNIRYEFFQNVRKNIGASRVAVAHNLEDNAETIIMNFIRGAGISGLKGMEFNKEGIIRPVLNISKKDILNYLAENDILYAIDKTNFENDYTRNKIRNDLIKKIESEYNPNFVTTLNRMAKLNKSDEYIIKKYIDEKYKELCSAKIENGIKIRKDKFIVQDDEIKFRLIRKILEELLGDLQGIEMIHVNDIKKLIDTGTKGKKFILGSKFQVEIENKKNVIFKVIK